MAFGLPVDPEVYRMNSGSSVSTWTVSHLPLAIGSLHNSSYQWSRVESIETSIFVLRTTMTFSTVGENFTASSTICFMGKTLPLIHEPSTVITTFDSEPSIRALRASDE